MQEHDIDRRTFVQHAGIAAGALAIAGCMGQGGDDDDEDDDGSDETVDEDGMPAFPEIEDPPSAVYLPTHRESMRMLEPVMAGDYMLAPMLSYPHPFWLVTGGSGEDDVQRVDPEQSRGVHLMMTLWDAETGIVLPVDTEASITLYRNGEQVDSPHSPWPMISQEMGFHFGDNVPLEEDGTYTAEVDLPPISTRTTGDLEGRFEAWETATFEFEYDQAFREEVTEGVEYLDEEEWGELGALAPMDHGGHDDHEHDGHDHDDHDHGDHHIPYSELPPIDAYPGTLLVDPDGDQPTETGELPRSDDAAILATLLESGSRLADTDERYLLVSPRTPYNRVPLADMNLSVTVERDGETIVDGDDLDQTIDSEFDLHYGASLPDVEPGDSMTITIDSPPQVARHQGYDTAFLEMPDIELTVPES